MIPLDALLAFRGQTVGQLPNVPPPDAHILVTDTLDASGSFVLMHYLQSALQTGLESEASSASSVLWLGCHADGLVHWDSIARKAGIPLAKYMDSNRFRYMDVASRIVAGEALPDVLKHVHLCLSDLQHGERGGHTATASTVVLVDDLSVLQWCLPGDVGANSRAACRWVSALRQVCADHTAALVTLMHADTASVSSAAGTLDAGDENLFRHLLRTSDIWVAVNELTSGRAADCDGEVSLFAMPSDVLTRQICVHPLSRPALAATASGDSALAAFQLDRYLSAANTCLYRIVPDGSGAKNANGTRSFVRIWPRGSNQGLT